jgi:alkylation response protein AidB-like acyl-CoA dehydrogenase
MAVTNPDAPPYQRASMILVPKDTAGLVHVRNISVMGHAGSGWISHAELELQEVRVPVSSLLGPAGQGFVLAQHRLGPGRIHHCMRWLGASGRALDLMKARAKSRSLGPDSVLADKQLVQQHLAVSAIELNAARLATLHAAWRIMQDGAKAARLEISLIKVQVAQTLQRIVDRAIQVHGALGVTDDTVLSFLYREERAARIYDGADEVHLASIAKQLLKA